ncbi:MAG: DUF47 family protein [Clostridia bacterium]|nr:DUF47 family protein [Clostridia bacterium]
MKKESYNYFNEFITMSECIVKSAEILRDVLSNFDTQKLEEKTVEVHRLENDADQILHTMRNNLIKDFLPPIEREDIILIGHKLDDIEDSIDEILINLKIFNVTEVRQDVSELADILLQSATSVKEMFLNFKNLKRKDLIKEKIIEVNDLEDQGDRIYEKLMSNLYRTETNSINLVKWTNIYEWLENAIDCCEQVSDSVEDVILSNS